jgi:hypothetical protein
MPLMLGDKKSNMIDYIPEDEAAGIFSKKDYTVPF